MSGKACGARWLAWSRTLLVAGVLLGAAGPFAAGQPRDEVTPSVQFPKRPNIVFILADDLGYGDLGCYGQLAIQTPNVDRLARSGIRFLNYYAGSSVGSASRCCLLTGKHTGHAAVRGSGDQTLPDRERTVAAVLKQAGYVTALIGKWGIGYPVAAGTLRRHGFDYFFGFLDAWHAHNYYPDFLWRNETRCAVRGNVVRGVGRGGVAIKKTQYVQDLLTAEAMSFIEQNRERPFFLFVAFTIPHANNEAGAKGLEVPNTMPYASRDWPEPQKRYAAMVTRLDYSVGRIVDLLRELKLDQRTVVFFSSDNGPHTDAGFDPTFFNSTGGLRGHKGQLYEGGIRVPLVVWWPGVIKPGQVTSHVCAAWDFLPTAAALAGVEPPKGLDGLSFVPTLLGQTQKQREHLCLFWQLQDKKLQAVRFGDWKAIHWPDGTLELYDLKNDPSEKSNLAGARREVVRQALELMVGEGGRR